MRKSIFTTILLIVLATTESAFAKPRNRFYSSVGMSSGVNWLISDVSASEFSPGYTYFYEGASISSFLFRLEGGYGKMRASDIQEVKSPPYKFYETDYKNFGLTLGFNPYSLIQGDPEINLRRIEIYGLVKAGYIMGGSAIKGEANADNTSSFGQVSTDWSALQVGAGASMEYVINNNWRLFSDIMLTVTLSDDIDGVNRNPHNLLLNNDMYYSMQFGLKYVFSGIFNKKWGWSY